MRKREVLHSNGVLIVSAGYRARLCGAQESAMVFNNIVSASDPNR